MNLARILSNTFIHKTLKGYLTYFTRWLIPAIFFLTSFTGYSQDSLQARGNSRIWLVTGINVAGYGGSLILLNNAWYRDHPKTSFHTFNDSREWLQVDKIGHVWSSYNIGRASTAAWRWAGLSDKPALWLGGLSGAGYLTIIEFLDAYSAKWGWSWADIAANMLGSGIFIGQELGWKEQRVQVKFSFHTKEYKEAILDERANELFGNSLSERMLKDYNGQTYWLSVNIKSFTPGLNLPEWLNLAAGYGADGMFGGFENTWTDRLGNEISRHDIPRKRQFYLSPDIDLTKIKTKSKFLKTSFFLLNAIKIPAPALTIDTKGKIRAYALYF